MEKMKLLYLASQRLPTEKPYGRQIAKMCSNFANSVDLELVYPTRSNTIKDNFFDYYGLKRNFKVSKVWAPDFYLPRWLDVLAFGFKNLISALILARAVLIRNPDLVYSRDELPLYILSFFRKNLVFEPHKIQNHRAFLYRRLNKKNVKAVAITQAIKDDLIKLGFGSENVLVAPDGVDEQVINREEANPSDPKSARTILKLPLEPKLVVYTGSLYQWKGVYTLADTAKLIPDALFVIVGGDQQGDEAEFKRYLTTHDVGNVKVTGYMQSEETVRNYLAAADVLVLSNTAQDKVSQKYTSPLKLFAYMAARRPIVASDLPSLREVLNESNSILVLPDNSTALAEGIKKLLNDSVLSEQISETAFRDVKRYTWEKRTQNILSFIC